MLTLTLTNALRRTGLVGLVVALGAWSAAAGATSEPWVQGATLVDGMSGTGHFGVWTAIEGDTAVVTAPDEPRFGNVYVFHHESTGRWTLEAVLHQTSGPESDSFGQSAGLYGDTIVVGTYGGERAFVFHRSATGGWSQTAVLKPSDGEPYDAFGFSVAISSSGILVGALGHDHGRGAAYFFSNTSGSWRQTAELTPPASVQEGFLFGLSVALAGSTAAVGAPSYASSTKQPGEVFAYQRGDEGTWTSAGRLQLEGGGEPGDGLGRSVAVTGREVVVGAADSLQNPGPGSAYVFGPTVHGYNHGLSLLSTKPRGFGYAVAAYWPEILVGANEQEEARGAVYAFHSDGRGGWPLQQQITPGTRIAHSRFGNGVALDQTRLLVGADAAGNGAAYVFRPGSEITVE
jgi:hypothetical protein